MNADRWRQIEEIFHRAVEVSPAELDGFLERECGGDAELGREVRSLLAEDRGEAAGIGQAVKQAVVALEQQAPARRVGPYQLLERIGRGGMGTVYRAQRVDQEYQSTVAIKLVQPGMDTDFILSRFRRERQTLARLNHPNIARLLDGGTTAEGTPYIVLEFIDGVWITEYCRQHHLSVRECLRLFVTVCGAVDYAHRLFVIHRDIKPGNILVDGAGRPKLLDFGICKLLYADPLEAESSLTRELGLMTPDYASPEQVQGETIGPVSDIYSLGAVLYEVLTGVRPHRVEKYTPLAVEAAICHRDVPRASAAAKDRVRARELQGDLDNILARALEKSPERRYESAAVLADDLTRYLQHRPVRARADSHWYRAGKFVRRHRSWVAGSVAVTVAAAAGVGTAWTQWNAARDREAEVRGLSEALLSGVYDGPAARAALRYLDGTAARGASTAEAYARVAEALAKAGDRAAAAGAYRKALERVRAAGGNERLEREWLVRLRALEGQ
ncbi:MAG: serine/threonine-protein kinase [Bryobacteraceae bacterium]|nr:serine/threonine-protein kinase [Bryobacteraceae bacterium]